MIKSAITLCQSRENSVSIVEVPGKKTGFFCMESCLSCGDIDVCLIPEIPFELYGEKGLLHYVAHYVKKNKHFIAIIAEGAQASDAENGNGV